jgi:MFS transporter, SP family, general alpha glucoside:H+ symporter
MSSEKTTEQRVGEIETADSGLDRLHNVDLHDKALNSEAFAATTAEHSYGFVEGIKTYRRAAIWSVCE